MESFGSNKGAKKNNVVSVETLGSDEVKTRIGGRVRAFLQVFEAVDKVEQEGGDWSDLRTLLAQVRDGVVSTQVAGGAVKKSFYVGQSLKGNYILVPSNTDHDTLTDMFVSVFSFPTKKAAVVAVDTRNTDAGYKVF